MGHKHSPETRAKMSAAHKGRPHSASHRARLSEVMRRPEVNAKRIASLAAFHAHNADTLKPEQVAQVLDLYERTDAYTAAADWLISSHYVYELAAKHGRQKRPA